MSEGDEPSSSGPSSPEPSGAAAPASGPSSSDASASEPSAPGGAVPLHTVPLHTVPLHDAPERARVVVLGAGMAGLAAAHQLLLDGVEPVVLEARDRLGGRVWTDRRLAGFPVELGAEFIHGDRAALWSWVERLGLRTHRWRKADESWVRMADGRRLTMREARATDTGFEVTRTWDLPRLPVRDGEDFEHYLRRVGFDETQLTYVRRGFGNAAGDALRSLDAAAVLDSMAAGELDGEGQFRVLEGFGAILEALGLGLEILTRREVRTVRWGAHGVRVETADGGHLDADRAIVTLPLGVLQRGAVRFDPPLPERKRRALAGLRMGPVVRLVYRFEERIAPDGVEAIYAAGTPPMWWTPSAGREGAACVWTALVSGDGARELASLDEGAALAQGLEALRGELGRPRLAPVAARRVDWAADPYALGGYSHVVPGRRGAREALAEPTPPLYWAGEATAVEARAATVHGALVTGLRAADEVVDDLLDEDARAADERPREPARPA